MQKYFLVLNVITVEEVILLQPQYETPSSNQCSHSQDMSIRTFANPEPNTCVAFMNLVAVAFDLAMMMKDDLSRSNVVNSFNSHCLGTFCTIKYKIPCSTNIGAIRA